MKTYKTVRVGKKLNTDARPYYAGTYVLESDVADKVIAAGGEEVKPPAASVKADEKAAEAAKK